MHACVQQSGWYRKQTKSVIQIGHTELICDSADPCKIMYTDSGVYAYGPTYNRFVPGG